MEAFQLEEVLLDILGRCQLPTAFILHKILHHRDLSSGSLIHGLMHYVFLGNMPKTALNCTVLRQKWSGERSGSGNLKNRGISGIAA